MRRVFLADAHLRKPSDENYQVLLRFLSELRRTTRTLFILGDLFEFCVGYGDKEFPHYQPILEALEELVKTGTKIVYFEGNHDFHLNDYFSKNLKATIIPKSTIMMLDGKRVFMCHGDLINSRDYGYRLLRLLLHNQATKVLIQLFPPRLIFRIANLLSSRSKTFHRKRNKKWDYKALLSHFAEDRFREGCDAVVTAHYHLPHLTTNASGKTLLSLGDWITQFSYGELSKGTFTIHTYGDTNQNSEKTRGISFNQAKKTI